MLDEKSEREVVLKKILNDPIFSTGGPYQQLLQYLFKCYQENHLPTETEIAINVFDKKEDFNPFEDTLVRVNFYRLRKKLDEYYNGPGKDDSIRLVIPKGHHTIEFTANSSSTIQWITKVSLQKVIIISTFLFLLIIGLYLWSQNRELKKTLIAQNNFASKNIIWSDFVNSDLKISIVIGELFSFYINKEEYNHEWLIRDDQINSYEELHSFIEEKGLDQSNIYLPGWDIIPKSSASNLLNLYNVLGGSNSKLEVKITSEVTLENIRENNIIYIGHFHNLKHLINYLPNKIFNPSTKYIPNKRHPERHIRVTAAGIDTLYQVIFQYDQIAALNSDYVLVSKVPGPNDNIFLFIVSFLPLGRLETIKMLTHYNLYSQLISEIQLISEKITPFFELLIEVKGYEEKGFESRVKHFFPLP